MEDSETERELRRLVGVSFALVSSHSPVFEMLERKDNKNEISKWGEIITLVSTRRKRRIKREILILLINCPTKSNIPI